MAILSKNQIDKYRLEEYQYGTDVRKGQQLYGMSGKIIYEGRWISTRADLIIIVEMNETIADREALFYLEVKDHKHIIGTLGLVQNSLNLTIFVQEFARFNDLGSVLLDKQLDISHAILKEMFVQVADAMSYVAGKGIVHGDLGCRNVLVFRVDRSNPKKSLVKITDFGLARWIDRPPAKEDKTVVPIRYCAPEILRDNRHASYSEKSDVYSMAVLMWEALSDGEMPYAAVSDDEKVADMKRNNKMLKAPPVFHPDLWNLMKVCWNTNREKRLTFVEIKDTLSQMDVLEMSDESRTSMPHTILQERAPHGNLQSLLESGQFQPSVAVLVEIFQQIIDAMIDIVGHGFVHGDLCCENILVFEIHATDPSRNKVKIANSTLARPNDPEYIDDRRVLIPVRYCALEILRSAGRSNYSELSDVYSMGVLMWQAFAQGKLPYESSRTNIEVRQRKLNGEKLSKPSRCSNEIWLIIVDCWNNEPNCRFEFAGIKKLLSRVDLK